MNIRQVIDEAHKRKEWNYKKLAQQAAMDPSTVNRYLRSERDMTGELLGRVLDALGLVIGTPSENGVRQVHPHPAPLAMEPVNLKAVLRLPGSKWKLMGDVVAEFPPHRHFVSLFGGTGNDILRKPPSQLETFNDIDGEVTNFFRVIQNPEHFEALKDRLTRTPAANADTFNQAADVLENGDPVTPQSPPNFERAWAFLVISHQGFCSYSPPTMPRYARKPHATSESWVHLPDALDAAFLRFRKVQVFQYDWSEVITKTDSADTFFFADPPYLCGRRYYGHTMTEVDHKRLLASLTSVQGTVMLFGHDHPLYDQMLQGWRRMEFRRKTSLDPLGTRPVKTEVVWMNYGEDGEKTAGDTF